MHLHTYLNYGGNCEEAFRFYETHLGARLISMMRHGEQPGGVPPPDGRGTVLHARLEIGGTVVMGADILGDRFQPMRSAYLSLTFDSSPEVERIYALLGDGGQIFMPLDETFFAHRFGMLRDRFGTSWLLMHPKAPVA